MAALSQPFAADVVASDPPTYFVKSVALAFVAGAVVTVLIWLWHRVRHGDHDRWSDRAMFRRWFLTVTLAFGFFPIASAFAAAFMSAFVLWYRMNQRTGTLLEFLATEFTNGSLALAANTLACLWLAASTTWYVIPERDELWDLSNLSVVIIQRAGAQRRPRLVPRWLWDRYVGRVVRHDHVDAFWEILTAYRTNNVRSVLARRVESPLVMLPILFYVGVSLSALWWLSENGFRGTGLIVVLNWLAPFFVGQCGMIISYAMKRNVRAPGLHHARAAAAAVGLLVLLLVTIVVDADYVGGPFLLMLGGAMIVAVMGRHGLPLYFRQKVKARVREQFETHDLPQRYELDDAASRALHPRNLCTTALCPHIGSSMLVLNDGAYLAGEGVSAVLLGNHVRGRPDEA